ncbi:histidine kinase HHK3 [Xylariaceae sp. FL0804]|nr:histidine kinase HHK3 [Xylariaceae sp. FL0804]
MTATVAPNAGQRLPFFPKSDAAVLSSRHGPPPARPQTVWPIFDPDNLDRPIDPWPADEGVSFYPPKTDEYAPSTIPPPKCLSDRYLRAFLAKNERLRLSMLWYYTHQIFNESELLCGLREKVLLAQESTGWECVVIGILDVNIYIRLATIGLPLAILPRGETICAHTITQPPGSIFLMPNLMEDWRFRDSPYVESGGLVAYAGAPLRLQNEDGDTVGLGSLCVCSRSSQPPLTRSQQSTLARLADWVVSDIVQCARARRQRERHRMIQLIAGAQAEMDEAISEAPLLEILRTTYPDAVISLQSSRVAHIELDGRDPIPPSDLENGLWEDVEYLDDFILKSNHQDFTGNRVVRVISAPCESISGPSLLIVATKDFRMVFDDIDAWFVQTCASMMSRMWHKRLLAEAMRAKEKFLRGFSHQLRTPIHGILGSAELLAEELKMHGLNDTASPVTALLEVIPAASLGETAVYLDTIKTAGRDLISIVNNMITLNKWADVAMKDRRSDTYTFQQLETDLAHETITAISDDSRYRASIFFHLNVHADCESLRIDLGLLRDSLVPLIINGVQYTSEGVVMVSMSLHQGSKDLVVDVKDSGLGVAPDDQERIFEPYERVVEHSTGAGLGLTLASKFATLLHGSVTLVSSDPARGSHFQAVFRDVECVRSPLPSQLMASKLAHIPSKFYHHRETGLKSTLLCDYLARFLVCQGFAASESPDGSFAIVDFVPDPEQRRAYLSQLPPNQVSICLIPTLEADLSVESTSGNVVYVRGPFLTSTLHSALEEADELTITLSKIHDIQRTNTTADLTAAPSQAPERSDQAPELSALDNALALADSSEVAMDPTSTVKSRMVVPIFTTFSSTPKPTALLVDDNTVNLRIMQMYCKKRGLPYLCATDGLQAVDLFTKHQSLSATGEAAPVELILMDLQMPVCDGIDATRQIRSLEEQHSWKKSIIVIVTGQDSQTDRTDATSAGANDYHVKPIAMKVLDRCVKRFFPAFAG